MASSPRSKSRSKRGGFLEGYSEAEQALLKAEPAKGRPSMREATSPNGDAVIVRMWPRRTKEDDDLVDIWRHELRQLHRLGGYPGAQRFIARVADAGMDARGFYIVLDAGQRQPLEALLQRSRGATEWLRALNLPANRHRLWANLQRVVSGLEILHNEGLVHRNLDGWAVLTTAADDPDFQLTGFEWSLRLSATAERTGSARGPEIPSVSFAADWAAFAWLAARVFNITPERLKNGDIPDYEVHESASAAEVRLLRDLIAPSELTRVDAELVTARITEILGALEAAQSAVDGRYHLVLRLNADSPLSRAVREASGLTIEIDDIEGQLAFITADLGTTIDLIASGDGPDTTKLFARGRTLVYRVWRYRPERDGDLTWTFALCEDAEAVTTWRKSAVTHLELPATALRLLRHTEARGVYQRMRGRVPSWTRQLQRVASVTGRSATRDARMHSALMLLHGVELAVAAASVFPVAVENSDAGAGAMTLSYRGVAEYERLSEVLGLEPPQKRLAAMLDQEEFGDAEGWLFTEKSGLGQAQPGDVELTLERIEAAATPARFHFRQTRPSPLLAHEGFLISAAARGDFVQFRRRSQAIRGLKDHTELLQMLADPRGRLGDTHDKVEEDAGYAALDEAKRKSLQAIFAVLPIYLLQGPPGVGKTYLIKDLVRRYLAEDRSARLLVTAQGNHAIDHLVDELIETWTQTGETPLAVRCRPKDDRTKEGPIDLSPSTETLFREVARSALVNDASPAVKARLAHLARSSPSPLEQRALEGLVMRSANLVFATTNSADLGRLLEEHGQFDWTIIEEAGKATGAELITPLMLSHRRLLIGDHKQLPPFGAEQFEALLNDHEGVRESLLTLAKVSEGAVRTLVDEDLIELLEDDESIESLCTEAQRALYWFESALTAELERLKAQRGGRPIASTLSVQHRMHPTICEIVSESFYDRGLTTSQARRDEAEVQAQWLASRSPSALPDKPFVWIDMPYERSATGQGRFEKLPRFTNDAEVSEIVRAVAKLRATDAAPRPPSLVVLTPYARQMQKLHDALLSDSAASQTLEGFRQVARGGAWCSTVDAFQGNEADVVLFSLVRNNRGATIRRALGFVADQRRFNVLLSRARQRMIFVGSCEFLEMVARPTGLEDAPESAFLRRFLDVTARLRDEGKIAVMGGGGS